MSGAAMSFNGGIGFGVEQTYGTPVTVDNWIPANSDGLSQSEQYSKSSAIFGNSELVDSEPGLIQAGGSIPVPASGSTEFGLLLQLATRSIKSDDHYLVDVAAPAVATGVGVALMNGSYRYMIVHVLLSPR